MTDQPDAAKADETCNEDGHEWGAWQPSGHRYCRYCREPQAVRAAPAPVGEDELTLRTMLAICYAGSALYRDDGELQDSRSHPFIDFKRDSVREISRKMGERALAALRQPAGGEKP